MSTGLIDITAVTAIAAFSDGTGEKMIQAGTGKPTPGFAKIWQGMRTGEFGENDLMNFLTCTDWEPKVQDDRCLALLSKPTVDVKVEVPNEVDHSTPITPQASCDKESILPVKCIRS